MLQGTLDVFSLDEVLGLLSGANKSGVLNITGDRGVGTVAIADGHLVGGSASSAPEATQISDVLFELLRFEEGSFSFDGGAEASGEPRELATEMDKAHRRLEEWSGIEAVVPSLDHHLTLAAELSTSQVTLSESEWATIVAIGEGASVGVVARRLGLGEFDGSKRVKSLVERSLAMIEAAAHTASPVEVPEMPVFTTPEPAATSFDRVLDEEPAIAAGLVTDEPEIDTAEVATGFAFDAVADDAPSFDDHDVELDEIESAAPEVEIPAMPEPPSFEAAVSEAAPEVEIPAMPEPPSFEAAVPEAAPEVEIPAMPEPPSFESADAEIPPMPEPPAAAIAADDAGAVPPPPAPPAPSFGDFDPVEGGDMFEPPQRKEAREPHSFAAEGFADFDAAADAGSVPPPPPAPSAAVPSFDPPAFDADAFATESVESGDTAEMSATPDDAETSEEKGGSLLMRYLKSNG